MPTPRSGSHRVFCYGTLKRGGSWHHLIASIPGNRNRFVGTGKTQDKLPLLVHGIPYIFDRPGTGYQVKGEVFDVDDYTLRLLDKLEHHPDWYQRRLATIVLEDGEPSVTTSAWVYFCQTQDGKRLLHAVLQQAPHLLVDEYDERTA